MVIAVAMAIEVAVAIRDAMTMPTTIAVALVEGKVRFAGAKIMPKGEMQHE